MTGRNLDSTKDDQNVACILVSSTIIQRSIVLDQGKIIGNLGSHDM